MIQLTINGLEVSVEEGTTLLEAARFLGFPIPTLCHMDGLTPYGACRLCVVEIGEGTKSETRLLLHLSGGRGSSDSNGFLTGHEGTQDDSGTASGLLPTVQNDPGSGLCP